MKIVYSQAPIHAESVIWEGCSRPIGMQNICATSGYLLDEVRVKDEHLIFSVR